MTHIHDSDNGHASKSKWAPGTLGYTLLCWPGSKNELHPMLSFGLETHLWHFWHFRHTHHLLWNTMKVLGKEGLLLHWTLRVSFTVLHNGLVISQINTKALKNSLYIVFNIYSWEIWGTTIQDIVCVYLVLHWKLYGLYTLVWVVTKTLCRTPELVMS